MTASLHRHHVAVDIASGDHHPTDWMRRAACRDHDPELFFPHGYNGPSREQAEAAKAVCRRCPVIGDCERYRVRMRARHGVWHGVHVDGPRRPVYTTDEIATVRRMAAEGAYDHEIATVLGRSARSVQRVRQRLDIKQRSAQRTEVT